MFAQSSARTSPVTKLLVSTEISSCYAGRGRLQPLHVVPGKTKTNAYVYVIIIIIIINLPLKLIIEHSKNLMPGQWSFYFIFQQDRGPINQSNEIMQTSCSRSRPHR